ncbi:zinc ABC transporter ATP-binding protein AztA [Amycolatopsis sp. NPDC054798]
MSEAEPAVVLRAVRAGYGQREVLAGVDARLPKARTTAVVGANGAGKSTLLNVVAGVQPLKSGSVRFGTARRPAYVTQHSEVSSALPLTVRAAVAMARWAHRGPWRRLTGRDRRIVDECLERLDIAAIADRQLGAVSGGQRQRALVAQGLAQQSDLLLLDEPAAGMDLRAQSLIDEALDAANRDGVTVLRVTHDLAVAERAAHCLLLREGQAVAEGAPTEVLTRDRVAEAWGMPLDFP